MIQKEALQALCILLPHRQVFTDRATLIAYEVDAGLDKGMPDAVVFPRTPEDVGCIMRWASEHQVALIARGAGTGLSGGAVADRGGVIVEFVHMNAILDIDPQGRSAVIEPALINLHLDEAVKSHGLYFPPDPASQRASTIGGNVAENSGGPHCFKYGVTTNYVTGLEVVLADGKRIRLGGRALDYPEYDLCGLVTGSEGTLALITAITVRLVRNPPGVKTLLAIFDSVEQAGEAVSAVIAAGLVPATLEMMDKKIVRIIEPFAHAGLPLDAGAVLIVEIDGYVKSLEAQMHEIVQVLEHYGGHSMRIARDEEERARIWKARKSAGGAIAREVPAYYTVDITVPRSRLAEMLHEVYRICEHNDIRAGQLFHAGDGNLHPMLQIPDPDDPALLQRVHRAGHEIVKYCVEMGGSLTGEHGVGIEKREFMPLMHTPDELLAMWDIKQIFDPTCLLNPGKIFPASQEEETRRGSALCLPTQTGGIKSPLDSDEGDRKGQCRSNNENDRCDMHPTKVGERPRRDPRVGVGGAVDAGWGPCADPGSPSTPYLSGIDPCCGREEEPHILFPSTAQEAAQQLLALSNERKPVFIQSVPETNLHRGLGPRSANLMGEGRQGLVGKGLAPFQPLQLSAQALSGIKDYAPDDLVITVGAGTPLLEIQSFLAQHRQQLALVSPWSDATIGGLIATNTNAPLRMRYGAIRDQVLCMTVALPDGRVIRTGRPIVKNVAGYDLTKAFIGSYGTLGLICDVALKISAQPREQRTVLIPVETIEQGMQFGQKLIRVALTASAIILCKGYAWPESSRSNYVLIYTAEGLPEDIQAELTQVRELLTTWPVPPPLETDQMMGSQLWSDLLGTRSKNHIIVRTGVPIKSLSGYVQECGSLIDSGDWIIDIANGFVYTMHECASIVGNGSAQGTTIGASPTVGVNPTATTAPAIETTRWLNALRAPALKREGYAIVMDMPVLPEISNNELDCWGYQPDCLPIMQRLKERWDAAGILESAFFLSI